MKVITLIVLLLSCTIALFGYDVQAPYRYHEKYNWKLHVGIEGSLNPSNLIFPVDLYYTLPLKSLQNKQGMFSESHAQFAVKNHFSLGYNDVILGAKIVPLNFLELGASVAFRAHYDWANMGYRGLDDYTYNYTEPIGSGANEFGMYYKANMRFMADISYVRIENNIAFTFYQYQPFVSDDRDYLLDTNTLVYLPLKQNDIAISNNTVVMFEINEIFSIGLHNLIQGVISTGLVSDRINVVGTVDVPLLRDDYLWFYGRFYAGFYPYDPYYNLNVSAFVDGGIKFLF